MIVVHKQFPKYLLLKEVLQETLAFCFQKSHIANLKEHFERSLQCRVKNSSITIDQKLEKKSFLFFLSHIMLELFEKIAYKLNFLLDWHATWQKSNALFFDKVWGLEFRKALGMGDGWINTVEIVVIKIDKEGSFTKNIMADVIMTAFIIRQRHLLSTHRYLAACGVPRKWDRHGPYSSKSLPLCVSLVRSITSPLVIGAWKTLLIIIYAVWVSDFQAWGASLFLLFLLITPCTVVFHPPRRCCLCWWVSLKVGTNLMCIHSICGNPSSQSFCLSCSDCQQAEAQRSPRVLSTQSAVPSPQRLEVYWLTDWGNRRTHRVMEGQWHILSTASLNSWHNLHTWAQWYLLSCLSNRTCCKL